MTAMKPKSPHHSRFRERSIPSVAKRLKLSEHELRRAVQRGEVQTFVWGGLHRIPPAEEARIAALLGNNA